MLSAPSTGARRIAATFNRAYSGIGHWAFAQVRLPRGRNALASFAASSFVATTRGKFNDFIHGEVMIHYQHLIWSDWALIAYLAYCVIGTVNFWRRLSCPTTQKPKHD
jgi:hypothetical protein